jgi:signal transduction histidine kinase
MSFEEQTDFARQVADLNKYGQALNRCESVQEVVSLAIEAMSLLFDPMHSTFIEVRNGDLRVQHSTNPALSPGDEPSGIAKQAYEKQETITETGNAARIEPESDAESVLAVPALTVDTVTAVLVIRSATAEEIQDDQIRPMEILASHAATAISNIRSRERLERAHQDLETRKEMIEMYDRLLRHDIGNDLQVIAGFSEFLVDQLDGEPGDYAERIHNAAESSADLISRVGDLVSTLEEQDEPEPRDLEAILSEAVEDARTQFDDLTLEYDPEDVAYQVFGGELLDSVFDNLISNAVVHNEEPVTVRVTATENEMDEVVIRIADDGVGVPNELAESLFEMGQKGPDSTGTGFGLGFVRALTESYGGGVSVGDSEMGGAAFEVRLERA